MNRIKSLMEQQWKETISLLNNKDISAVCNYHFTIIFFIVISFF